MATQIQHPTQKRIAHTIGHKCAIPDLLSLKIMILERNSNWTDKDRKKTEKEFPLVSPRTCVSSPRLLISILQESDCFSCLAQFATRMPAPTPALDYLCWTISPFGLLFPFGLLPWVNFCGPPQVSELLLWTVVFVVGLFCCVLDFAVFPRRVIFRF